MKKLLTLCALLLGVVGAHAVEDETIFLWQSASSAAELEASLDATGGTAVFYGEAAPSSESAAYNSAVTDNDLKVASKGQKLGKTALYLKVTLTENKLQANDIIYICGYLPFRVGTSVTSGKQAGTELATSLTTGTAKGDYNVGTVIVPSSIGDNVTEIYISRAEGNGTGLAAVKIVRPAPATDPVISAEGATIKAKQSGVAATQSIAVSGMNLTGSKLTASLSPAVNGLEVSLTEEDITDGAISTTATLSYTETENVKSGTTTLTLSDGTTAKEVTITYLAKVIYSDLETISETTTWDFSKGISGGVQFTTDADKNTEYVYVDIPDFEDLTFTDEFNAKSLAFKGEYPFRGNSNKYAMNGTLHFKTLYPGHITVTFSDTGTSASATATKRYLVVNGQQTEYWTSRANNSADGAYDAQLNVTAKDIYVPAGDVYITGSSSITMSYLSFTPATTFVEVGDKLYRTFASSSVLDFTEGVEGLTAYAAIVEGDNVKFEPITGKVPAKTGMLLKADAPGKYIILKALDETTAIENNAFIGVAGGTDTAEKGSFVLYDGEQGLGFYKTTAEAFTVEANTAYIPANVVSPARTFIALDGETTGVNAARSVEATDGKMFDLQGRQVSKPTKGLYISNGKKYIVK